MSRRSGRRERRRPDGLARIEELYARIPDIPGCLGLCYDSCTWLDMSPLERTRIAAAGVVIPKPTEQTGRCPALTTAGRCSVYRIRPAVCRLWGTTPDMACDHGCQPRRWLSPAEAAQVLADVQAIGGGHVEFLTLASVPIRPRRRVAYPGPTVAAPGGDGTNVPPSVNC